MSKPGQNQLKTARPLQPSTKYRTSCGDDVLLARRRDDRRRLRGFVKLSPNPECVGQRRNHMISAAVIEYRPGGVEMQESDHIKEEARRLIDALPDDATWADFTRMVFERQMVEEGIADLEAGRTWTSDQIREKLGIF